MARCDIININTDLYRKLKEVGMPTRMEIAKLLETLIERAEREINDVGYFRDIVVKGEKGTDFGTFAKNIALVIEKDPRVEGRAFLSVSALHPQLAKDSTVYLTSGNREEILKFLKQESFPKELNETITELDNQLKELM